MAFYTPEKLRALRGTTIWRLYEQAIRDRLFLAGHSPTLTDREVAFALEEWKALKPAAPTAYAIILGRDLAEAPRRPDRH